MFYVNYKPTLSILGGQ